MSKVAQVICNDISSENVEPYARTDAHTNWGNIVKNFSIKIRIPRVRGDNKYNLSKSLCYLMKKREEREKEGLGDNPVSRRNVAGA